MTKLTPKGIGESIRLRASIAAEMAAKIAKQEEIDGKLRIALAQHTPEELRPWINNEMILELLFWYGSWSTQIEFGKHGFVDAEDASRKMQQLSYAWEGVVTIHLDKHETHRVQVQFGAVM